MLNKQDKPTVIIKYARLLDPFILEYMQCKHPKSNEVVVDPTTVQASVERYREYWPKYQNHVFKAMQESMDLEFKRDYIDVYIVSKLNKQFCDPLVLRSGMDEDLFVISLSHELTHLLFMQNNDSFANSKLRQKFAKESATTQNHIYTFAFLKYLFIDVLHKPLLLKYAQDISSTKNNTEYQKAWQIVEEIGYQKLLAQIKERAFSII